MFPAVSIDVGFEISISSYVQDSFAFTSSFLICEFLLSKMITKMTRKIVIALTINKIMIKIVAVKITGFLSLLLWSPKADKKKLTMRTEILIIHDCRYYYHHIWELQEQLDLILDHFLVH